MKQTTIILSIILTIALSSCTIPDAYQYHQASSDVGQLRKSTYTQTESDIDLTLRNLPIRSFARSFRSLNYVVFWFLNRGEWEKFYFTSTDFQIYDLDKNITIPAKLIISPNRGTGPYYRNKNSNKLVLVSISLREVDKFPDNFKLLTPTIVIDGKKTKIPPIHFKRTLWVGLSVFP